MDKVRGRESYAFICVYDIKRFRREKGEKQRYLKRWESKMEEKNGEKRGETAEHER